MLVYINESEIVFKHMIKTTQGALKLLSIYFLARKYNRKGFISVAGMIATQANSRDIPREEAYDQILILAEREFGSLEYRFRELDINYN